MAQGVVTVDAVDDGGFDAIIVAGGAARRLGGADKGAVVVDGATLLQRAVWAVAAAQRIVVVGPRRPVDRTVRWTREDPPGGGPVAALAAGLSQTSAAVVVLLAADLPRVAPAVPALVAAARDGRRDAAALVDASGRVNHLAAAWRRDALMAAVARIGDPVGAPMRLLGAGVDVALVTDPDGWGRDCDTWDDVEAARAGVAR